MKKGFTLIELLVVVLIIGILSAVALPQYQKAVLKTKIQSLMPILKAVVNAEELYYLENGSYALKLKDLAIDLPNVSYANEYTTRSVYGLGSDGKAEIALQPVSHNDVYLSYDVPGKNYDHTVEFRVAFQNGTHKYLEKGEWACRDQSVEAMTKVCKSLGFTQRKTSDYLIKP